MSALPVVFTVDFRQVAPDSNLALRRGMRRAWIKRTSGGVEINSTISLANLSNVFKKSEKDAAAVRLKTAKFYLFHRSKLNPLSLYRAVEFWFGYRVDPTKTEQVQAAYRLLAVMDYNALVPVLHPYEARRTVAAAFAGKALPAGRAMRLSSTGLFRFVTAWNEQVGVGNPTIIEPLKSPGRPKQKVDG